MQNDLIREACVESFQEVKDAISKGANRIELNDNMANWGTTPSAGNIYQLVDYCQKYSIPIIVMNRPRGGNFQYTEIEKEVMKQDLEVIIESGADGVAVGALNEKNTLDKVFLDSFISQAKKHGLEVTFHRAFDSIPSDLQIESLLWLANRGVDRIATHGGADDSDILENVERLKELSEVDKRIQIMAGGGVTKENYKEIIDLTGISEVHGTRIV